jgi:hypothetical protein
MLKVMRPITIWLLLSLLVVSCSKVDNAGPNPIKEYEIGRHLVGFGSLACKDAEMKSFIARMLAVMPEVMKQKGRDMMFAKIDNLVANPAPTDVDTPYIEEGTYFIFYSSYL